MGGVLDLSLPTDPPQGVALPEALARIRAYYCQIGCSREPPEGWVQPQL